MTPVLDTGALIALERSDRAMWARLKTAVVSGVVPVTHGGVVGQVWRGAPRQALLDKALRHIVVRPLDTELGRAAGVLLGRSGLSDVVDAALVLLATDGDRIFTSDPDDVGLLAAASDLHVDVVRV